MLPLLLLLLLLLSCRVVSFLTLSHPPSRLTSPPPFPPSLPPPYPTRTEITRSSPSPSLSEKVLGGAAGLAQAAGTSIDNACRVANAVELREAITTKTCPVVILTSSERHAYVLTDEIVISRPVVVMGNSVLLPYIDCAASIRGFRVVPGGYLDLQFVRINIGKGITRKRWGLFRKQKTRRNMQGEEVVLNDEVSVERGRGRGRDEGGEEGGLFPSYHPFDSMSLTISMISSFS